MLHQSAFLLALRNASPGTECASPTSVPHFLVDRPFAVVWLYFSWLPRWRDSFRALGGSLFGVPSTDRGSRLRDMSNFCCLPGRAGGTPLLVSEHTDALNAFDPTFWPHAKRQTELLSKLGDEQSHLIGHLVDVKTQITEISSLFASMVPGDSTEA